jgi:hypothetical protein
MESLFNDYLDGPTSKDGSPIKEAYEIINPALCSNFDNQRRILGDRYLFMFYCI